MKTGISRQMFDCLILKYRQFFLSDLFFVSMNQEMYMSADPDCPLAKDEIDASLTSKTGVQTKNKTKKTQKKTRKRSKQKKRQESVQRETKTR